MKKLIVFRLVWLIVAIGATAFTITDGLRITDENGLPARLFFTSWSVWLGFAVAVFHFAATIEAAVHEKNAIDYPLPAITFCSDCMLFITAFVIMLGCIFFASQVRFFTVGGFFKHVLLPLVAIADALCFAPESAFKKRFIPLSAVFPLGYWAVMVMRAFVLRNRFGGAVPSEMQSFCYPYPFMNADNGWGLSRLTLALAGFCAALIAFGFVLCAVSHRRKGKKSSLSFLS